MPKGITFGQWIRKYGLEPFPIDSTEIAFGVCERMGWTATPQLIAYLRIVAREEGFEDGDSLGEDRRAGT